MLIGCVLTYFKTFNNANNHKAGLSTLKELKEKADKGEEEPFLITSLAVNGKDLINKGLKGEQIGFKQRELIQLVKAKPEMNTKEILSALL